jgi:hypothetical protein
MVDAPAEAMTQFRVVELGQNAPPERRIVDIVQNVNCFSYPADFGERTRQAGGLILDLECPQDSRCLEMPEFQRPAKRITSGQFSRISARLMVPLLRLLNGP